MRKHFHAVRIARPGVPELPANTPAVIYCNHPSWWDPAFIALLATRVFAERRSFGPIDDQAIGRYGFMRRIGFFAVRPNSHAGARTLLRTGSDLLAHLDTLLWITPEGAFTDPRKRPVSIRPGLPALLQRAPRVIVVPLAFEYPFWTERTPEALARFGTPIHLSVERAMSTPVLHRYLEDSLGDIMDALARDAIAKDPARFITLLDGTVGVGGMYDLWRRASAALRGRKFESAHVPSLTMASRERRP